MNKKQFELILKLLNILPHKKQVEFALYCAKDAQHLEEKKISVKCLDLVEKWLKDDTLVAPEELLNAANAIAVRTSTFYATAAAAFATDAATSATNVINAAYYAINITSYYNIIAAANPVYADVRYKTFNKYYQKLLEIADFDDLEKAVYQTDILCVFS